MGEAPETPGRVEAWAAAIAGPAFAGSLLFLRGATLLPPELFDAGAALLLFWGVAPLVARRFGPFPATLARGLALALAILLLARALYPPFDQMVLPALLLVAGGTLLQARARAGVGGRILDALGVALLVSGAFALFYLASGFPEPGRLRFAVVVGLPLALGGLALRALALRKGRHDLAPMPVGLLGVALLAATYVSYRGLVAATVANLPLYEWTLGVGVALLLLTRLRRQARRREVEEAWRDDARRHAQDVTPLYDARLATLVAPLQRYLDTGQGFDEYRAAIERAAPDAPLAFRRDLANLGRVPPARGKAARAAAETRRARHESLMSHLRTESRGRTHGDSTPRVRTDP